MKGILGTKVGMTSVWQGERLVPVTVVLAGPCSVVQRMTPERDGYSAVQLGWDEKDPKRTNRPDAGHFKAHDAAPQRHLIEFRDYAPEGDTVTVDIFEAGQHVDVTGTSKGRGTSGVMRRWNFSGMPRTHGTKKKHRHGGSIGQRKNASRVWKGKKMAGRMGNERVTTQALELVDVRADENLLLIKGAIPGPKGGLVIVRQNRKDK